MVDALRTPAGRPVINCCSPTLWSVITLYLNLVVASAEETTYLSCPRSNDPSVQVLRLLLWSPVFKLSVLQSDFYSGGKGHDQCVQVGNICDTKGYCWAVQPGASWKVFVWKSGFQGICVPRLGDAAVASLILGVSERGGTEHIGASNLFRGTADIGTARIVDKGYVKQDRNTMVVTERCQLPHCVVLVRKWKRPSSQSSVCWRRVLAASWLALLRLQI